MQKIFKPKFPHIPRMISYKGVLPDTFWGKFPVNLVQPAKAGISIIELDKLVHELGCRDWARLERLRRYITEGADIGCKGMFRASTQCGNAPSSYQSGPEVSDAVACWVTEGYAYGPVEECEVPAGAKINGIMVRKKPNGSARIILNLSAPVGLSVNEGITAEEFPAVMSSTSAWLCVLNRAGRGAWMSKTDWASAYKQVTVRPEDTDLQWFEWGGRFFKELCLIFGSASSAGIFDDAAKIVLDLVCRKAKFDCRMVCQHLDDICAAAGAGSTELHKFDEVFMAVAGQLGVKLAPRDDPDKTFAPSKRGTIFGVVYDTEEWVWSIPEERLSRMLIAIEEAMVADNLTDKQMQSLAGKLINVRPLVPTGKFNMDHIMRALADSSTNKKSCLKTSGAATVAVLGANS